MLTFFCCLPSGWVPQDQLRARLLVTRQQVTQAETQLQELQLQSSRIEVLHHVLSPASPSAPWTAGDRCELPRKSLPVPGSG